MRMARETRKENELRVSGMGVMNGAMGSSSSSSSSGSEQRVVWVRRFAGGRRLSRCFADEQLRPGVC